MTDAPVVDDLRRASAAVADLVARVPQGGWTSPTPCTEWHVRDLVGHLVGMDLVLVAVLGGGPMPSRDDDHLGEDPATAYRRSAEALLDVAARPGVLEATATTPVGTTTGEERLRWRVVDLVVHAWDLAQALGTPVDLPPDLVESSLAFAAHRLPHQPPTTRFTEPRPAPDGAPALERLVALTGRAVPWPGAPTPDGPVTGS